MAAGAGQWPLEVPAGGTRSAEIRLAANRPGVVQAQLLTPLHGAGAMGWWFVHEDGRLRHCQADECKRRPGTIAEGLTGGEITVEVRNECSRDIEFLMMPGDSELPPPDAPRHRLAEGARRDLRIDGGLWLRVIEEDGAVGGSAVNVDGEGMRVRFHGERCDSIVGETIAAGPWDRR
ncbi:MAG: hypothetical protein JNL82_20245 [Myxococcales bacterium]|nr:hypothetical protein [Myxococcales bacterium]